MLRKALYAMFAAIFMILALPSNSQAWFAYHYHYGGYGGYGGYHYGGYHYGGYGGAHYGYYRRW